MSGERESVTTEFYIGSRPIASSCSSSASAIGETYTAEWATDAEVAFA